MRRNIKFTPEELLAILLAIDIANKDELTDKGRMLFQNVENKISGYLHPEDDE